MNYENYLGHISSVNTIQKETRIHTDFQSESNLIVQMRVFQPCKDSKGFRNNFIIVFTRVLDPFARRQLSVLVTPPNYYTQSLSIS